MSVGAESPALVSTELVGETEVETRQRLFNRIAPMYDTVRFFFSQTQIVPCSKIFFPVIIKEYVCVSSIALDEPPVA